jgi:GrpB-like predicted nucleotidyltransferase (UPF0157 family)
VLPADDTVALTHAKPSASLSIRSRYDTTFLFMTDSLGLADGVVEVRPHDPAWSALYDAEAARLQRLFAQRGLAVRLEHMGSTAVPGLAAKPILDILGGHDDAVPRARIIAALVDAGYTHRGEQGIAGRDFFRLGTPRKYHLHLTSLNGAFWRDQRAFRDHLRTHDDAAAEYAALKHQLAATFPRDRPAYIDGKTAFVQRILAEVARTSAPRNA